MFDLTPLTPTAFLFLLASFSFTFFAISYWRPKYAGYIPALVITLLALPALENISQQIGLAVAVALIIVIGRADEAHRLSAASQLGWQVIIGLILVFFGWTIPYVTNPFGEGVIFLGIWSLPATLAWIILMMNAINWLDGLDGLASIVSIVALVALGAVSLLPATQDSTTLHLALVGAGGLLGFFLHNAPPARTYLGTAGSWFVGVFLALTAVLGGGKIATAGLVLALPVVDALFVIGQRLLAGQRPWIGDKKHLHYRLSALGWKVTHIILAAALLSALLGIVAVTAQTQQKIWVLGLVALFLAATILSLSYVTYARQNSSHR